VVRPKRQKRDKRFGTWNVRNLYKAGSVTAAARELADLVGLQYVRWDKGGQGIINFYMENETKIINGEQDVLYITE
jgi:hypothetical protein